MLFLLVALAVSWFVMLKVVVGGWERRIAPL